MKYYLHFIIRTPIRGRSCEFNVGLHLICRRHEVRNKSKRALKIKGPPNLNQFFFCYRFGGLQQVWFWQIRSLNGRLFWRQQFNLSFLPMMENHKKSRCHNRVYQVDRNAVVSQYLFNSRAPYSLSFLRSSLFSPMLRRRNRAKLYKTKFHTVPRLDGAHVALADWLWDNVFFYDWTDHGSGRSYRLQWSHRCINKWNIPTLRWKKEQPMVRWVYLIWKFSQTFPPIVLIEFVPVTFAHDFPTHHN